jgi:hypothetical protein
MPEGTAHRGADAGFGLGFGVALAEGLGVGRAVRVGVVVVAVADGVRVVVVVVGVGDVAVLDELVVVGSASTASGPPEQAASRGTQASHAAYRRAVVVVLIGRSAGSRGWPSARPSAAPGW